MFRAKGSIKNSPKDSTILIWSDIVLTKRFYHVDLIQYCSDQKIHIDLDQYCSAQKILSYWFDPLLFSPKASIILMVMHGEIIMYLQTLSHLAKQQESKRLQDYWQAQWRSPSLNPNPFQFSV
jgi:hypothetical protein